MNPEVVVIGGVNIDIGGRAFGPLKMKDSNPGKVTVSLGGVGRNIAHNLRLLGTEVCLLTALGEDLYAQRVEESCGQLGIDISHALTVPGGATSTYVYLDGPDGDMALALSDMEICDRITPAYLELHREMLGRARLIVMDTNILPESLAYVLENIDVPVFVDPVSTTKAEKLRPMLRRIHTLKPNRLEAELLSGIRITDPASLFQAARVLLDTGMNQVAVSLGAEGVLAADTHAIGIIPGCPAVVRNATGAGDAFTAALAWAWLEEKSFTDACRIAAAAAAMTVESMEAVNTALSAEAVLRRAAALTS